MAEGDHVVADAPLVSVETEKAVVEVPSPQSGYVKRLLGKPGDRVKVGAPLVDFDEVQHPDSGTVVGDLGAAPAPLARRGPSRRQRVQRRRSRSARLSAPRSGSHPL